jgi:hypothetical protein
VLREIGFWPFKLPECRIGLAAGGHEEEQNTGTDHCGDTAPFLGGEEWHNEHPVVVISVAFQFDHIVPTNWGKKRRRLRRC